MCSSILQEMRRKLRVPRGEKRKNKANSKKPTRVTSTIVLPLHYNRRDAAILDQRFAATGRLRNATLGTLLERADAMRADPGWVEARTLSPGGVRSERYHELRKTHGVNAGDAVSPDCCGSLSGSGVRLVFAIGPAAQRDDDADPFSRVESGPLGQTARRREFRNL